MPRQPHKTNTATRSSFSFFASTPTATSSAVLRRFVLQFMARARSTVRAGFAQGGALHRSGRRFGGGKKDRASAFRLSAGFTLLPLRTSWGVVTVALACPLEDVKRFILGSSDKEALDVSGDAGDASFMRKAFFTQAHRWFETNFAGEVCPVF